MASQSERNRDPLEEGEDKSTKTRTSGNREESMRESGKDAFGDKSAARNPSSASSGTTSLSGESSDADSLTGPGGVEGESGTK